MLYEPAIIDSPQPEELVGRMQAAADAGRYEDVVEIMVREVLHMPEQEIAALQDLPTWASRVATAPTLPREEGTPLVVSAEEMAAVRVPTLLIEGEESPAFLRDAVRVVADGVEGARVVTLEGHQHVADQVDPEMFARVVLDFLLE